MKTFKLTSYADYKALIEKNKKEVFGPYFDGELSFLGALAKQEEISKDDFCALALNDSVPLEITKTSLPSFVKGFSVVLAVNSPALIDDVELKAGEVAVVPFSKGKTAVLGEGDMVYANFVE